MSDVSGSLEVEGSDGEGALAALWRPLPDLEIFLDVDCIELVALATDLLHTAVRALLIYQRRRVRGCGLYEQQMTL